MKYSDVKAKFIKLRAEDKSYDFIARKLHKSKSTLYQWNLELKKEIDNMKFLMYHNLLEEYKLTQKTKIEFLVKILNKIRKAIELKDIEKIPLKDLIFLYDKYEKELNDKLSKFVYHTGRYKNGIYDGLEKELNGRFEIIDKLL